MDDSYGGSRAASTEYESADDTATRPSRGDVATVRTPDPKAVIEFSSSVPDSFVTTVEDRIETAPTIDVARQRATADGGRARLLLRSTTDSE